MRDERDMQPVPAGAKGLFPLWVAVALLALGYPLSVGPAARLYKGNSPPQALKAFYAPIEALYDGSETARRFFDWYVADVWGAK